VARIVTVVGGVEAMPIGLDWVGLGFRFVAATG
jgi:hypothetical protein